MGKKKKAQPTSDQSAKSPSLSVTSNGTPPAHGALHISRNKHWRFISAFHGPWLQLPPELLETLAHSNYLSPRPRQTDPGVLYNLLKIRKLVDEASDLAVRAQNGTASSALNPDNGMPGGSLGLNMQGVARNAKLSPERKHRMRDLATQKLAMAYRLDEIAASVATMQSPSTLDSVASLVLQRSPANVDAKYVHFFHERIPSRMMAEYTPLDPLDEIIAETPGHAATYRTRALARIFKDDHQGAIRDLTEALALCRLEEAKHVAAKNQLVSYKTAREDAEKRRTFNRDRMHERRVADEDQPAGMDLQLLFQRGNQFLTVACQHVRTTLSEFKRARDSTIFQTNEHFSSPPPNSDVSDDALRRALESRNLVRKYAKRALRDYTAFFSQLDYAHAPVQQASPSIFERGSILGERDADDELEFDEAPSQSLVRRALPSKINNSDTYRDGTTEFARSVHVHNVASLLTTSPPGDLPPSPPALDLNGEPLHYEMVTYHPFLPETLHSFLLSHALLQTPIVTLQRLATNVARLSRVLDGHPFFSASRSPSRADWTEVLHRTRNWLGLNTTWDNLCRLSHMSNKHGQSQDCNSPTKVTPTWRDSRIAESNHLDNTHRRGVRNDHARERNHAEAVMSALGDDRVVDDESFKRAVSACEKRADSELPGEREPAPESLASSLNAVALAEAATELQLDGTEGLQIENGHKQAKQLPALLTHEKHRGSVAKDEEYMIGVERAECIAMWVIEAPSVEQINQMGGDRVAPPRSKVRRNKKAKETQRATTLQVQANGASANGDYDQENPD